jgi:hypothetical protein
MDKGVANLSVMLDGCRRPIGGANRPTCPCGTKFRFRCHTNRLGPSVLLQPAYDQFGTGVGRLARCRPPGSGLSPFMPVLCPFLSRDLLAYCFS